MTLTLLVFLLIGCEKQTKAPKLRESKKEDIPEIKSTIDNRKARNNKLTDYFTVNENPILYNFMNLYNCEVVKVEDEQYHIECGIFRREHSDKQVY